MTNGGESCSPPLKTLEKSDGIGKLITYTQDLIVVEELEVVVRVAILEEHGVRVFSAILRRRPDPGINP